MAWTEVSAEEYARCFANPIACYLRADFNLLNASKVESVRFFAYEKDGNRLGIIFGEKGKEWRSPFSAPYGGFVFAKSASIAELDGAVAELCALACTQGKKLSITLPPVFYDRTLYAKVSAALLHSGFQLDYANLNYAFDYTSKEPYEKRLRNIGPRNLKQVSKLNYRFALVKTEEECRLAHSLIQMHYKAKGYPLWMSFEALQETAKIIPIDFFLLYLDEQPVASTIIYHVSEKIAQMIYWGASPEFWENRPLNRIAKEMFEYYQKLGFDYLDVGPAASDGIPSEGLCAFKESVGCFADLKFAFVYEGDVK